MKKYITILLLFIVTIGCSNKEVTATNESIIGKWQFNGRTDLQEFYRKYGNNLTFDTTGEIMKAGHLFLDGSYVEFKENNIASFESGDVKYEIEKTEENYQLKIIDKKGVESTHLVRLTPKTLHIGYYNLDKISDDYEIIKPIKIDMSAYKFGPNDLGFVKQENNARINLSMSKEEVDQLLGKTTKDGLYYNYDGLEVMYIDDVVSKLKLENSKKASRYLLDRNINIGDSKDQVVEAFGEATYKKYSWETYAFHVQNQNITYLNFEEFRSTNPFDVITISFLYKDKKTKIESITIANYYYGYQYDQ